MSYMYLQVLFHYKNTLACCSFYFCLPPPPPPPQANPDFANTMMVVQKLLSQIETVKERVEDLWTTRQEKLEANLRQRVFEKEAKQVHLPELLRRSQPPAFHPGLGPNLGSSPH